MKSRCILVLTWTMVSALLLGSRGIAAAQETAAPAGTAAAKDAQQGTPTAPPAVRLTLEEALARARKNSTPFQLAQTDAAIARQDRFQAGAALLPTVTYNNQAIYTKFNKGTISFIANNG